MTSALQTVPATPVPPTGHTLATYLGHSIRQLRQPHGQTIAEITQRAGISRGMLSTIENGLVSPTFRGELPLRPERLIPMPIRFLAIIHYGNTDAMSESV